MQDNGAETVFPTDGAETTDIPLQKTNLDTDLTPARKLTQNGSQT